jgi:hypothetical protein
VRVYVCVCVCVCVGGVGILVTCKIVFTVFFTVRTVLILFRLRTFIVICFIYL